MLQWGRDQMISESRTGTEPAIRGSTASMGPRSNDLGKQSSVWISRPFSGASMGPRSNDLGKHHSSSGEQEGHTASMGPRSNDLGKSAAPSAYSIRPASRNCEWFRPALRSAAVAMSSPFASHEKTIPYVMRAGPGDPPSPGHSPKPSGHPPSTLDNRCSRSYRVVKTG